MGISLHNSSLSLSREQWTVTMSQAVTSLSNQLLHPWMHIFVSNIQALLSTSMLFTVFIPPEIVMICRLLHCSFWFQMQSPVKKMAALLSQAVETHNLSTGITNPPWILVWNVFRHLARALKLWTWLQSQRSPSPNEHLQDVLEQNPSNHKTPQWTDPLPMSWCPLLQDGPAEAPESELVWATFNN